MRTVILSLGGSLIVPNKIDVNFLKNFKKLIEKYIKRDYRFAIYCGGGRIARDYQEALKNVIGNNQEDLDWIGISATRLNAFLLKCIFYKYADEKIIENPTEKISSDKKILIAAGWKPGWSTDYDAVLLAKNLSVKRIINISNVDYVCDKDPKKFSNAKKIMEISWHDYRKISGDKWAAGLNLPFDPVAAKEAQRSGITVLVIGKDLDNFENALENRKFNGTTIR